MTVAAAIHVAATVRALHATWVPHETQRIVLRKVFVDKAPLTFVECGRKWGKTETILYKQHRIVGLNGGVGYYLTPEQKQGREIVWRTQRAQGFCPALHARKPNETDMSLKLMGGGEIKIDGSDNIDQLRGVEPTTTDYDEYKDFRQGFHNAMEPNYLPKKAQILVCGTPPEVPEDDEAAADYDALRKQAIAEGAYFNFPSWANPHNDRDWLRKKRQHLIMRGEEDVWYREYAARRYIGGKKPIFPMFDPLLGGKHMRAHEALMAEIHRDIKKMHFQVIADPGTTTCFAVIFRAINPYTKAVYNLGEIYEQDQNLTSTSLIIPRIEEIKGELIPNWKARGVDWEQIYDEAGAWFAAEAHASFPGLEAWAPTRKGEGGDSEKKKTDGLSLIKDQMLTSRFFVSEHCENLRKEIRGYIKDKNGKIPKKNDHLIDATRYGNSFGALDLSIEVEAELEDPDLKARFKTPEQDMRDEDGEDEDFDFDEEIEGL